MLEQEGQGGHENAYVSAQAHVQGQEQGQAGRLWKVAALKQQEQKGVEHAYVNAQGHVQGQSQSQKQGQGQDQPEML